MGRRFALRDAEVCLFCFFCFLRSFSLKSVNVVSVCRPPICVRDAEVCLFCFLFFEVVLTEEF